MSDSFARQWFAIRVRQRWESTVASRLREGGYETLLPLCRSRRRWADRVQILEVPLFPGYVFCEFSRFDRLPIDFVPGVSGIVSFGAKLAEVDRNEIEAIRLVIGAGVDMAPWPRIEPGRQVEIDCGPLRGLIGVVIKKMNEYRLLLSVSLLNRCLMVEVNREWIRAI